MINRFITNSLQDEISKPEINILLGARQVGKTTILRHLEKFAKQSNRKTAFFDLEQPSILADFNQSDEKIIQKITQAGDVIFIDEFQYILNASKIFKAIFDANKSIKIFCSGSSSLAIHSHLQESLAGRRFLFRIFPLQYGEIQSTLLEFSFSDYLRYGGMPALTNTDSEDRKQQILSELLSSYILKDIKSLIKEENIRAFNHLVYLLAEKQGSTVSVTSLANQINLSVKAINRYLDILEETYVNFRIYSYSNNLGNELKKSCKTYLYDLGMRNIILKDFSSIDERPDKGTLLESYVFLKLQTLLKPNMDIKFWRTKTGEEVDFVVIKNRKPIPIEVKSKLAAPEIPRGLRNFLHRYPDVTEAYCINESLNATIPIPSGTLKFMTFENFENSFKI